MRQLGNWLPVRSELLSGFLGSKQIRLGVSKVPGPLHIGDVGFSEPVTSLMEIPFTGRLFEAPPDMLAAGFRVRQTPRSVE